MKSDAILERLLNLHPKAIDLVLDRVLALLDDLGRPHEKLPPVVHIAGTNGKGSTLAFLRAILEAADYSVHAYTSPHLVNFNERIRLAGKLIDETTLVDILYHCEQVNDGRPITYFEITTVAAFYAFANEPADIVLLECGLGGQFDATTVIDHPLATAITPVSMDHMHFLGDTLAKIAFEKAAIQKPGVPSIVGPQSVVAAKVISDYAERVGAPLLRHNAEWRADARPTFGQKSVVYSSPARSLDAGSLALPGEFQIENAGTAIAIAVNLDGFTIADEAIRVGLSNAEWPARLQRLERGRLASILPSAWELWLDGGHNEAAATALASVATNWNDRPLHLVFGMLNSKEPEVFLKPLAPLVTSLHAVTIPNEENALPASDLAQIAHQLEIKAHTADSVSAALQILSMETFSIGRVLICGSLYLAGIVLAENS